MPTESNDLGPPQHPAGMQSASKVFEHLRAGLTLPEDLKPSVEETGRLLAAGDTRSAWKGLNDLGHTLADERGMMDQAMRVFQAAGDIAAGAGLGPLAADSYFNIHTRAHRYGDEEREKQAIAAMVAASPPSAVAALRAESLPPADPQASRMRFGEGMTAVSNKDLAAGWEAFRQAALLDRGNHAAFFCYAVALSALNRLEGLPVREGGPTVKEIGAPTYALLAWEVAAEVKAGWEREDPAIQAFSRSFADENKDAVWAACDRQSAREAPWLAEGLIAEYLGDVDVARDRYRQALQRVRCGHRCAIAFRALQRLSRLAAPVERIEEGRVQEAHEAPTWPHPRRSDHAGRDAYAGRTASPLGKAGSVTTSRSDAISRGDRGNVLTELRAVRMEMMLAPHRGRFSQLAGQREVPGNGGSRPGSFTVPLTTHTGWGRYRGTAEGTGGAGARAESALARLTSRNCRGEHGRVGFGQPGGMNHGPRG